MPKRKSYAVHDKQTSITQVKQGQSQAKVSWEYRVPESTLHGWLKDESKLRDFVHTVDESRVTEWIESAPGQRKI